MSFVNRLQKKCCLFLFFSFCFGFFFNPLKPLLQFFVHKDPYGDRVFTSMFCSIGRWFF